MNSGDDQATLGFTVPAGLSAITVRYELVAELGRGGMGIVYKARDRQTGDLVAVKVIHPSIASDAHAVARFKNELLLARRITHRNVCRVHELTDFGGATVIAMELVEGHSLRELLRDAQSLSIRRGLRIVRQIAAGLSEAHGEGVVHRDLKPENILIGRDDAVKIMDFGIARLADARATVTGLVVGTPAYMSPEQAEGRAPDARSDVYSLGLVMYEMFCGQPAFSGDTPVAVVAKQVHETAVAPRAIEPDLPERIDNAIRRCLEKDPARRFQSVAELDAALVRETTAAPIASGGDELPERLTRWQRGDWIVLAAAALGLAVFFPCFARTSLAPHSQVTFDRTVLSRIAEEHLQRLGIPPTPVRQMAADVNVGPFIYLGRQYGASAAREATNNPIHYWVWSVTFDGFVVKVDQRGRLTQFARQESVSVDPAVQSQDDARRQAAKAIEDFFGQAVPTLELEREIRGEVYGFDWRSRDASYGLQQHYTANVDRRGIALLDTYVELPPQYSTGSILFGEITMNEWGLPVSVVIGILVPAFGFINRRRVAQGAAWRTAVAALSFVGAAGFAAYATARPEALGVNVANSMALGLLYAVVVFLGSIALEVFLRRTRAWKLGTLIALFTPQIAKQAPALSVVRGTLVGLALLGADTCALWLGTTYFGARLSPIYVGLLGGVMNGVAWPMGLVLAIALAQVMGIGLLVAFTGAIADRLPGRRWIGVAAGAALLAASGIRDSMGTVLPWYWTWLTLFVDYTILVAAFRRFDLLAVCVAVGTFAFWWANYPLFVMQRPIGSVGPWTAFVAWGLVVGAAATVAFQSPLRRGYQRVAAALE
jgi:protein kinase-like protein